MFLVHDDSAGIPDATTTAPTASDGFGSGASSSSPLTLSAGGAQAMTTRQSGSLSTGTTVGGGGTQTSTVRTGDAASTTTGNPAVASNGASGWTKTGSARLLLVLQAGMSIFNYVVLGMV